MLLKIINLLKMNELKNCIRALNIFFILILLSGCNGEFNLNKINKKNNLLINPNKINKKDKLEISISCDEGNIENYLKDGWKIKDKKSKEKVCSWKSIPANNTCDINKDKGCKIIKPESFGIETIYFLEK
tara:strand:+ start:547 stop:936 length:390 start_codon:yes stop_codon:yes gene_type:complete